MCFAAVVGGSRWRIGLKAGEGHGEGLAEGLRDSLSERLGEGVIDAAASAGRGFGCWVSMLQEGGEQRASWAEAEAAAAAAAAMRCSEGEVGDSVNVWLS